MKKLLLIIAVILLVGCGQTRVYTIETEDCSTGKLDTTVITSSCEPEIQTLKQAVPILVGCWVKTGIINVCKIRILHSEPKQINKHHY